MVKGSIVLLRSYGFEQLRLQELTQLILQPVFSFSSTFLFALKKKQAPKNGSQPFCKDPGGKFGSEISTINKHLTLKSSPFHFLDKSQIDRILRGSSCKVSVKVYYGSNGSTCALAYNKLLEKVTIPLDLRGAESRPTEPDPRFVFQFGGKPECSPQVFRDQGNLKQAVFTCKFGFRNSSNRSLGSSLSESKTSRNWLLPLKFDKEQSS
ncbi:uncharacterized protein LOC120214693 [Hibiscus syriacus]|uniref:uncharacterized protein LOC120214693 n=1 Tax=Hibiscus syriacus TaxID=106335 RepID=UPI0019229E5A|nr:uncharacterized protein LOC120214693 [Hibiscus syriacus]